MKPGATQKNFIATHSDPCASVECHDCCHDMDMSMTVAEFAIWSKNLPPGTSIVILERESQYVEARKRSEPNTIYILCKERNGIDEYLRTGKHANVRISICFNDDCCNWSELGGCDIYEERPQACRNFEFGSQRCAAARSANGNFIPIAEVITNWQES